MMLSAPDNVVGLYLSSSSQGVGEKLVPALVVQRRKCLLKISLQFG